MSLRALLRTAVAGVGLSVGSLAVWVNSGDLAEDSSFSLDYDAHRPAPRARRLSDLTQKGSKENPFDVLVVGGGATGAGIALDAATRGLKVACVEKNDFGSGTSSRSTKLIHGGVRYLEKAVFQADLSQLKLVFEALHERKAMMHNAPHLSQALPIMTPCYSWWELPYYWAGLKLYDLVAGPRGLTWSYVMPADRAHRLFPTLALNRRDDHRSLKGTIVYYDGQFNDARMNALLAVSAAAAGATMANHVAVVDVLKDDQDKNKITGVKVQDLLTGQNLGPVYAKCVVNATGAYSDAVRGMSQPGVAPMVQPSAGVHITLPDYYSPQNVGMIVPKTKDGRVVFMLPWLDHTIAGTTDGACGVEDRPQPKEEDINFILDALKDFLTVQVRRSDVMSAWSGIRPLAADPTAGDTENVSRDHVVCVENDGLVTIAGGKWTTYRLMAEHAVDAVLQAVPSLQSVASPCVTETLQLVGARGWDRATFTEVAQNYVVPHRPGAIDTRVAEHLSQSYGTRAMEVTRLAEAEKLGHRLARGQPWIEAEVAYCCRHEMCETAEDFIARRTRMAFLDVLATREALPKIIELMQKEKGWSGRRARQEREHAETFLATFDSPAKKNMGNINAIPAHE